MLDLCIRDLVKIVDGQLSLGTMPPLGGEFEPIGRIVLDCEDVEPGDVFWGLPGSPDTNGQFAEAAFMRSAAGAVVANRHLEPWAGKFSIRVQDSSEALWRLARWVRCRFMGQVVAVAGLDRRTTTCRMLRQTLDHLHGVRRADNGSGHRHWAADAARTTAQRQRAHATTDNDPAPICPPLGMLEWDEADEYAVVEIHGDSDYEIDEISHLCCPHIAAITCNHNSRLEQPSHSETFAPYVHGVLDSLPDNGWAILNGDDDDLRRLVNNGPTPSMWIGCDPDCDLVAKQIHCDEKGLSFHVAQQQYSVPGCGEQHLLPALITVAVGRVLGWTDCQIATGLTRYQSRARAVCW